MAFGKKADKSEEVSIQEINTGTIDICVMGVTPLICNRMSEKAWRELLMPAPPKNRASKASVLKHVPIDEYRASVYQSREDDADTALLLPVQCFKGAAMEAALEVPGSNKKQVGKLVWIRERWVEIYGVPELYMSIVRMANITRTPDVRTRAIVPRWAARFTVEFVQPILKAQSVINLFAAGGLLSGVGDYRQEKGKGNFGQFNIVKPDDKDFKKIVSSGGRKAQLAALDDPKAFDSDTEELLSWYGAEVNRRGFKVVA